MAKICSCSGGIKVLKVLRHLFDLSIIVILNFSDEFGIGWLDEVDSYSLSSESTGSSDSMDVVLLLERKLVVDNKTDLLYINTSCE
jgi:hypothetical protein